MYLKTKVSNSPAAHRRHVLKRMGLAGLAFFFVKGLLWLLVPWLVHSAIL